MHFSTLIAKIFFIPGVAINYVWFVQMIRHCKKSCFVWLVKWMVSHFKAFKRDLKKSSFFAFTIVDSESLTLLYLFPNVYSLLEKMLRLAYQLMYLFFNQVLVYCWFLYNTFQYVETCKFWVPSVLFHFFFLFKKMKTIF